MNLNSLNYTISMLLCWSGLQNSLKCFFSKKSPNNHSFIHIFNFSNEFLQTIGLWSLNSKLSLIDIVGVDISQLNNYNSFFLISESNIISSSRLIIYNFINYLTNNRLLFVFFFNSTNKLFTLENFFLNSNWVERELIEFLGIEFMFKKDTRNLLLDYTFSGNPLLKTFPTEGYEELYFNFNTYSLSYISSEFVEL